MNQQHETPPMRSTNFEFLRATQPKLADDADGIETIIHKHPEQAIDLLRSFSEHLLQTYVRELEGRVHVAGQSKSGPTRPLINFIDDCAATTEPWRIEGHVADKLHELRKPGNKQHKSDFRSSTNDALSLLQKAWEIAAWFALKRGWGIPADVFRTPPRGGVEAAELRQSSVALAQSAARPLITLTSWIQSGHGEQPDDVQFTGRGFIFSKIKSFLNDDNRSLLLIQGEPGLGKTTLIRQFLSNQEDGISKFSGFEHCVFEFRNGHGGLNDWIRHLYASLLSMSKLHLEERDQAVLQEDAESLTGRLRGKLREALNADPTRRVLFVLDAIDEAGSSEGAAIDFICGALPRGVKVIATTRAGHVDSTRLDEGTLLNLNSNEFENVLRVDILNYIKRQLPHYREETVRSIATIADANFLVATLLVKELLSKSESDAENSLTTLRELPLEELMEQLFHRGWSRLERALSADRLHVARLILGLLAVTHAPVSAHMLIDASSIRPADWTKCWQEDIGEYLRSSEREIAGLDSNGKPKSLRLFRLFHDTFAQFVRRQLVEIEGLEDELLARRKEMSAACSRWLASKRDYERAYALRFRIAHLRAAEDWDGLETTLTDLQFIQARFEAGQGHDLLAEYDAVLKADPQQDKEFKQRIEQDAALHQYVQDIVEYSRRCTSIRNRPNRSEYGDPIAEINQLKFPEPPDTTQTIKDMRRTEARQKNPAAHKPAKPTGFSRIRDFQQFIASRLQLLIEVPQATIDIARNYAADGFVAEMAHKFDSTRNKELRLIQGILPSAPPTHSLVIRSITGLRVHEYGSDARDAWMTPDARVALTVGYHTRVIIDLTTGRDITPQIGGRPFALSLDGRFALLQVNSEDDKAQVCLFDLNTSKAICEHADTSSPSHSVIDQYNITPDGSLVVGLRDNALFCWDTIKNETKSIWLDGATPQDLLLCHSGAFAAVRVTIKDKSTTDLLSTDPLDSLLEPTRAAEWKWQFFDLLNNKMICETDGDGFWTFIPSQSFARDFRSAFVTRYGIETADSKLIISNDGSERAWPRQVNERKTGAAIRQIENKKLDYLASISADGRYALASDREGIQVLSLDFGISVPMAQRIDDMIVPEVQETPQTCDVDKLDIYRNSELDISVRISPLIPKKPNLDDQDWMAKLSKWRQLLEASGMNLILGTSHQWHLPIVGTDNNESLKMTPDGSILLQLSPSTTITYLDSGDHMAIECSGEARGLTADARAVIFAMKSNSDDWTADLSHFAFWMLNSADWNSTIRRVDNDWHDTHMPPSTSSSRCSPDGRMLIGTTYTRTRLMTLNYEWVDDLKRPDADELGCYNVWRAFSRDGKFLIEYFDGCAYLWRVQNGKTASCVAVDSWQHKDVPTGDTLWIDCDGVLRDTTGRRLCLEIRDPHRGPAWVTGSRLFRIGFDNGELVQPTGSEPLPWIGKPIPGTFDKNITYCCQRCRRRSPLPDSVVLTVDSIHQCAGINAGSAPVLELPDEAWDDEPGLDFECPHCHQPHRSTPFYVDRKASS